MNVDVGKLIADLDRFDAVWSELEAHAACDCLGGAEYRRVRAEWLRGGRAGGAALGAFIVERANAAPRAPRIH